MPINKITKSLKTDTSMLLLLLLSMLYVTLKITCNPLFFRQIEFNLYVINYSVKLTGSALIYSLIYLISDLITLLSNRRFAIFIILFGISCDGLFSYLFYILSTVDIPTMMTSTELAKTNSFNVLGTDMWNFFYHGLAATIIASIGEVLLFALLYKKINSLFVSTILSVIITLLCHNIITDYSMLKAEPDAWHLIANNLIINISIMIIYTTIVSIFLKLKQYVPNRV